jgi:hypothetical protein
MTSFSIESLQHKATELRQQGQNWPDLASTFLKDGVPSATMLQVLLPLVDSYGGRWAIVRAAVLDVPETSNFIHIREVLQAEGIDLNEAVGHMMESGTDRIEAARRLGL